MDEIARRRIKPVSYNLEHGIAPQVVKKEIPDLIDGDYEKEALGVSLEEEHAKAKIQQMSEKQLAKEITSLEKNFDK